MHKLKYLLNRIKEKALLIITFIYLISTFTLIEYKHEKPHVRKFTDAFPFEVRIETVRKFDASTGFIVKGLKDLKITAYANRVKETDSSPNITRSGRMVYEGSAAVSQDLWNKEIFFGDILYVEKLNKYFVVEDTMNIKLTRRIDVFTYNYKVADTLCIPSDVIVIRATR